jgi:tetratricopeptide (TPR) repeat protein
LVDVHCVITGKRTESNEAIPPGNNVTYGPDDVVFSVPYERNPHFSGRELLLETLHQKLNEIRSKQYNHRIALFGLGGIGKTQLALEYTYRYKDEYRSIFWISAATSANLLGGYAEVAKTQHCSSRSGSPEDIAKSALNWFGANENWLLIIDNLDDIAVIDGFLPRSKSTGHTLITTRNQNCEGIPAEGFEVMTMTTDESVEFLLTRAKVEVVTPEVQAQAHQIVSELGNLPLAIEHAASYIIMSQNFENFLVVYRQSQKGLLFWMPDGNRTYNDTVGTTWRLSLDKLASISPVSIELIRLLVFLNPDEVMVEFLRIGASALRGELNTVVRDRFRFQKCVFALQDFSLIRVWDSGKRLSIHRLVQTVIKAELDENSRLVIMKDVVNLGLVVYPGTGGSVSENETAVKVWRNYGPQIISCFEQTNDSRLNKERHLLGERVADAFSRHCYSADALRVWTETSNMKERVLGPEHEDTLDSRRHQAIELCSVGQALKAVDLLHEVLPLAKRTLGNNGGTTLDIMTALAGAYDSQGQYTTALDLYQKVYEISLRKLGHENSATMRRMEDLALTYNKKGDHLKAADLFQKLVDVQTRQYGPDDRETLWSMAHLADVYENLCHYDKAVDLYETVYARMDATLLTYTSLVDGLANAYSHKGEYRKAVALREEILGLRTREFGA